MGDKCSIQGCEEEGVRLYDLYNDKPHFMKHILCEKHSVQADKELTKRGLRAKEDGTYEKV